MIFIIREPATPEQIEQMLQTLEIYIKIAVDIEQLVLAGGGEKHAECEVALLANGSRQKDIWGADWMPFTQTMAYESIINIRPTLHDNSRPYHKGKSDTNYSKVDRWL